MNCSDWRRIYMDLAEKYFHATGELVAHPANSKSGKQMKAVIVSPGVLRELYIEKGLRLREMAQVLECTPATVSSLLEKAGIPTRRSNDYPASEKQREAGRQAALAYHRSHQAKPKEHKLTSHEKRMAAGHEFGGHERKRPDGYIEVYFPEHPHANKRGYVPKHTLVMERYLGRYLEDDEVVHHKNHVRYDNQLENLQLMKINEHAYLHGCEAAQAKRKKKLEECGGSIPPPKKRSKAGEPNRRRRIDPDAVKALYGQGLHDTEIAKQMGVSHSTICGVRQKLGLPPLPHPSKKILDQEALDMYRAGCSNSEIALRFNVKKHVVTAWKRSMGLPPGKNPYGRNAEI